MTEGWSLLSRDPLAASDSDQDDEDDGVFAYYIGVLCVCGRFASDESSVNNKESLQRLASLCELCKSQR